MFTQAATCFPDLIADNNGVFHMSVPNILIMRECISTQLKTIITARFNFVIARRELTSCGESISQTDPSLVCVCDTVLSNYFKSLCKDLTQRYSNDTPAIIDLDETHFVFAGRWGDEKYTLDSHFSACLTECEELPLSDQLAYIAEIIDKLDFSNIYNILTGKVKALYDTGLAMLANNLIKDLNLSYNGFTGFYSPVVKPRFVVCTISAVDYWHNRDKITECIRIGNGLRKVRDFSNVNIGDSIFEFTEALNSLTYDKQALESRTAFGKGSNLEIHCFKGKYELRFTHELFDAIYAFFTLYVKPESLPVIEGYANVNLAEAV